MTEQREWDYKVNSLVRAVDGDTFILRLEKQMDFGFYLVETKEFTARFRILGVDAWEKRDPKGPEATRFATAWINGALEAGVLRGQSRKTDDFGRWLIDLYRSDTGERLKDALIAAGEGVPMRGLPKDD